MEITALEKRLEEMAREKMGARYVWFDYLNEKYLLSVGLITKEQFSSYEDKISKRMVSLPTEAPSLIPPAGEGASLFLSYNEKDLSLALRIKQELALHNVAVAMDDETTFGSIKDFIINQIREKTAVLWLVSEHSLKSSWVNYERRMAGFSQLLLDKHFIPVCETKFFMDDKFYDDAWDEFNRLIREDDDTIRKYKAEGKDPQIPENRRANRVKTRNELGEVLKTLQNEQRVLPIGPAHFSSTLQKIAQLLVEMEQQKRSKLSL